ncbi:MAG: acylphosphatase [Bacteroidetes bacterium]|nr:acylphosphatase [Bacteroidota bacterium]MBU1718078.1 acylphosphatase [Bacteroidota bacterium]
MPQVRKRYVSLIIAGRVQGVGFRYAARTAASQLGITGFAQNQFNGSVYIEACGKPEKLDEFVLWCRRGPAMARVTQVIINQLPPFEATQFSIR